MQRLDFDRKFLLLDTTFLIKLFEYSETGFFDKLLLLLAKNDCTPVINEFIRFEFLRGCKTKKHIDNKNSFLDNLSGGYTSLPITPDIIGDAIKISNIYSNKGIDIRQISPIDCYISSYLKKYSQRLILISLDNNDFPLIIHNRVGIKSIDTEKEILILGFYEFDNNKYKKALKDIGIS